MARQGVFGRKPALVVAIHAGEPKQDGSPVAVPPHDEANEPVGDTDAEVVECPKCGCVFDPKTGEVEEGAKELVGKDAPDFTTEAEG